MARIRPRTEVKAQSSTVSGVSVAPILATGAPQASASITIGAGTRTVKSSGTPQAQSSTVEGSEGVIAVGTLVQDAVTLEQIALYLPVTGTVSQSATASVEYKLEGAGTWNDALDLWRIQPQYSSETVSDAFSGVIFGLTPGQSYDVRVTVQEAGKSDSVQTLTGTTRSLVGAAGTTTASVSSYAGLVSALGSASPGDVIELTSSFSLSSRIDITSLQGTEENPIYIRGSDRDAVVVTYSSDSAGFRPDNCAHLVFENFTYTGSSADNGVSSSSGFLQPKDDVGICESITVRNMRIQGVDHVVYGEDGSDCRNFTIYDNICEGNNQYIAGGWGPDSTAQQTWDDDGVKIGGYGHCVFNNTFSWFGDTIAFNHSPSVGLAQDSKANFAYRNHITYAGDDAFELEYSYRNTAAYDNYIRNCATGVSIDGIYGGPVYLFRNRWINTRRYQIKNGDQATGVLIYNNTWVHTEGESGNDQSRGWYWSQTANVNAWEYRNNLVLWEGSSDILRFDEGTSGWTPLVSTNNGWGRNGTNIVYAGSGLPTGNVATVNASLSPIHDDDIEITNQAAVFTTPVVFGADYTTAITTDYTLELKSGAEGIGAGVNLPNISNGTDIGAYPQGFTLPTVGNRYTGLPSWYPAAGEITTISSGTTIGSVARAAGANSYPGTNPDDLCAPWCGGALVYVASQPYLVVAGGGHGDGAYNGFLKFGPLSGIGSDSPVWSIFLAASAVGAVQQATTYSDGRQAAVHTYNNLVGVDDELYAMATDAYYSPSTGPNDAVYKFTPSGQTSLASNFLRDGAYGAAAYHNGKIYYLSSVTSPPVKLAVYDIAGNSWSEESNSGIAPNTYTSLAADTSRGGLLGGNGSAMWYWDTATLSRRSVSAPPSYDQSLEYDAARDVFVSVVDGSRTVYEIDAASLFSGGSPSWSARAFSGDTPSSAVSAGTFGRFRYVPELSGYILAPSSESAVYFYRSV